MVWFRQVDGYILRLDVLPGSPGPGEDHRARGAAARVLRPWTWETCIVTVFFMVSCPSLSACDADDVRREVHRLTSHWNVRHAVGWKGMSKLSGLFTTRFTCRKGRGGEVDHLGVLDGIQGSLEWRLSAGELTTVSAGTVEVILGRTNRHREKKISSLEPAFFPFFPSPVCFQRVAPTNQVPTEKDSFRQGTHTWTDTSSNCPLTPPLARILALQPKEML